MGQIFRPRPSSARPRPNPDPANLSIRQWDPDPANFLNNLKFVLKNENVDF